MAKCADGSFYATVLVDAQGAETVLYNGAKLVGMQEAYEEVRALRQSYINRGEVFTVWNFDVEGKVIANRVEQRRYLPGTRSSVSRKDAGLKGEYEQLVFELFVEAPSQAEEVAVVENEIVVEDTNPQPFCPGDIVRPNTMYLHNAKWSFANVIGVHRYSSVDGEWVVDLQRMEWGDDGELHLTSVKEYMIAAWEVKMYQPLRSHVDDVISRDRATPYGEKCGPTWRG